jgi:hypothetical protein
VTPRQPFAKIWPPHFAASLAAFLAVGLLVFAGVKSTVMQAQAAAPSTVAVACPDMPGMVMPAKADPHKSAAATCSFCIAAANVALQSVAEPIPAPIAVAWIAPPPVADHSARGPPSFQPKARGPPAPLQTV